MKEKIAAVHNSPPQRIKLHFINSSIEDNKDCQVGFVKKSNPAQDLDDSVEVLEINSNINISEVQDEIEITTMCEDKPDQSESVLEISSECDILDGARAHWRNATDAKEALSRKRVKLINIPRRKKFKVGPSKFERKYDPFHLEKFLGLRNDKIKRNDIKIKETYEEDDEITFKFRHQNKSQNSCGEKKHQMKSLQNFVIDLTSNCDDNKDPSSQLTPCPDNWAGIIDSPETICSEHPEERIKDPKLPEPPICERGNKDGNHRPVSSGMELRAKVPLPPIIPVTDFLKGSRSSSLALGNSIMRKEPTHFKERDPNPKEDSGKIFDLTKNIQIMDESVVLSYEEQHSNNVYSFSNRNFGHAFSSNQSCSISSSFLETGKPVVNGEHASITPLPLWTKLEDNEVTEIIESLDASITTKTNVNPEVMIIEDSQKRALDKVIHDLNLMYHSIFKGLEVTRNLT